ncbi:YrdB family protein [Streptomyces hoynatensis]|uniref:DUF2568 domain-containing protein n=1 Tax=Streptomyces hoynatensis TaxID=1141874 RepID=A0A3A9Z4C0_9ACTN|nr:YrdB family protein [Streptomyces hoynatensis]RKN43123.1 DUF2568 domain-containing protein [Streptomyces hoynatensis]
MTGEGGGAAGWAGRPVFAANETLAFLVEVLALAFLAWWGFALGGVLGVACGIGAPAAGIALWGAFAAPRARIRLPLAGVLVVKALVLGGGAVALAGAGHGAAAAAFGAVAVANTALAETMRRRPR